MDQTPAEGHCDGPAPAYRRHRPEKTCLYQVVERYWPEFRLQLEASGKYLPGHVTREFDKFLECGMLKHGFLRVRCKGCKKENLVAYSCKCRGFCPSCGARRMAETTALLVDDVLPHKPIRQWVLSIPWPLRLLLANNPRVMGKVLGIVIRSISGQMADSAGRSRTASQIGSVTLIQRFGSALNLNIHFHIIMIDGIYSKNHEGGLRFNRVNAPTTKQLQKLVLTLAERIGRCLEREGLLEREEEQSYLTEEAMPDNGALSDFQAQSVTYRIAVGPQTGRKVMTVQTQPACEKDDTPLAGVGGFSLHAGVSIKARERRKLEKLCRYITRPSLSEKRLEQTADGQIRYELKTPYRDGTTEVIYEPLDFISKLAALVPKRNVNLTRYHGVLAPNAGDRSQVVPSGRGRRGKSTPEKGKETKNRRSELGWAGRLKRVFRIDVTICAHCGEQVRVIGQIDDPEVIEKILSHLQTKAGLGETWGLKARGPPRSRAG